VLKASIFISAFSIFVLDKAEIRVFYGWVRIFLFFYSWLGILQGGRKFTSMVEGDSIPQLE
jgi:hypothetical protein